MFQSTTAIDSLLFSRPLVLRLLFTVTALCYVSKFKCDPKQELHEAEGSCIATGNQSGGASADKTNSTPQQTPSTGEMQRPSNAATLWSLNDLHMKVTCVNACVV